MPTTYYRNRATALAAAAAEADCIALLDHHAPAHDEWAEATCLLCDAVGHGYPGAGPCPLEVADYSGEPWWAL